MPLLPNEGRLRGRTGAPSARAVVSNFFAFILVALVAVALYGAEIGYVELSGRMFGAR